MNQRQPAPRSDVEEVVDQFDQQWRKGRSPDLADFLEGGSSDPGLRREMLVELIAVDLEYRWKCAHPGEQATLVGSLVGPEAWLLESYVERWPELGTLEELPMELIAEEYRVRQRWGDRPAHADYLGRFPGLTNRLAGRLAEVDAELAGDSLGMSDTDESRNTLACRIGEQFRRDTKQADAGTFEPREFGRYRLLAVLGQGAMGVVYLAEDRELHRKVALKTPRLESASGERIARFLNEARTAAALSHPNLCPVYDVGQVEGQHFITMAHVEGQTLAERLRRHGPLPAAAAVALAGKIARAMQSAHERGVIHRDLKSSNIMIDARGEPVVMDFGLARRVRANADARLTQSGQVVGSPAYMAPEQVEASSDQVGPATDVYALGVVLFEMLTGQLPFQGESVGGLLAQILRDPPPSPSGWGSDIPPALEVLCLRMLAKRIQDRPDSMQEVAQELASIDRQLAHADTQTLAPVPAEKPSSRRRLPVRIAIACLTLLALVALAVAPLVLRVQTKEGEIVIRSFAPDIEVTVKRNGKPVEDFTFRKGPVSTRVQTGDIEIEIKGGKPDGVQVRNGKFQLTEGEKVVVEIVGPTKAEQGPADSPFDALRREDIGTYELKVAGSGDPADAPEELVAVLGDGRLQHRTKAVVGVAFPSAGKTLASVGDDNMMRFWGTDNGELLDSIPLGGRPLCMALSRDGNLLALGLDQVGQRVVVGVWDARTRKKTLQITNLDHAVQSLTWAPDGKRLVGVVQGDPSRVTAWDAGTGREVFTLKEDFNPYHVPIALSPDGELLVTGSELEVKLWDARSGKFLDDLKYEEDKGYIRALAWSPDGKQVAGSDSGLHLWEVESRKLTRVMPAVYASTLAWSPDGKWLASGSGDAVHLWDAQRWVVVRSLVSQRVQDSFKRDLAFSADSRLLAGAGWHGNVALWDVASGKEIGSPQGHSAAVTGVAVSPAGRWITSSSMDRTVRLWESASGKETATLRGGSGWFNDVAFSPDGARLAAVGITTNAAIVWDLPSREKRFTISVDGGQRMYELAWSPDGRHLALGCVWPHQVKIIQADDGKELYHRDLPGQTLPPPVAFSPDGKWLAVGGEGVEIWDPATGKDRRSINTPGIVHSLGFSPDGRHLLAAGTFDRPAIIEAETGKQVRSLLAPADRRCLAAVYDRTGSRIATLHEGEEARRLIVWNAADGKKLRQIQLPGERRYSEIDFLNRIAFAPNGRHVLVANSNGTVYVLRILPD